MKGREAVDAHRAAAGSHSVEQAVRASASGQKKETEIEMTKTVTEKKKQLSMNYIRLPISNFTRRRKPKVNEQSIDLKARY